MATIRKAKNAGAFYPGNPKELEKLIEASFKDSKFGSGKDLAIGTPPESGRSILGGICPHAGYVYSGFAAAYTHQEIVSQGVPDIYIILGNDHLGYNNIAIMTEGIWETPLGNLEIDKSIAKVIADKSKLIKADKDAFFIGSWGRAEHNIEVQLPFIKYIANKSGKDVKIVTLKFGYGASIEQSARAGEELGNILKALNTDKDIVIIASSDMFHQEPHNYMEPMEDIKFYKEKEQSAIKAIEALDYTYFKNNGSKHTICGQRPISAAITATKILGATHARRLTFYTSYESQGGTGPSSYVVAYLSAVFEK